MHQLQEQQFVTRTMEQSTPFLGLNLMFGLRQIYSQAFATAWEHPKSLTMCEDKSLR